MNNITNNKGSIVLGYVMIAGLLGLAASVASQGVSEKLKTVRSELSSQAFWLAEAGTEQAKWDYNFNDCQGFVQSGTDVNCSDCVCNDAEKVYNATFNDLGSFQAAIDVTNTYITSSGIAPVSGPHQLTKTVQVELDGDRAANKLFTHAIYAKNMVVVGNNSRIDSYNSVNGRYGNSNRSSNGDVGTNSSSAYRSSLGNNAIVDGSMSTGSGGSILQRPNSQITGEVTHENARALPDVVVPTSFDSISDTVNHSGNFHIGNYGNPRNVTFQNEDRKMRGLNMHNNSTLTIEGDVKLYLWHWSTSMTTGNRSRIIIKPGASLTIYANANVHINQNSIVDNQTGDPSKLVIYNTTRVPSYGVNIGTNPGLGNEFVGAVYVPNGTVRLYNNAQVSGAFVGNNVLTYRNVNLHYDENLVNLNSPFSGSTSISGPGGPRIVNRFRRILFRKWRQLR